MKDRSRYGSIMVVTDVAVLAAAVEVVVKGSLRIIVDEKLPFNAVLLLMLLVWLLVGIIELDGFDFQTVVVVVVVGEGR